MSDTNESTPETISFDTWQQAINASMDSPKTYIRFAASLGLADAAKELDAGFKDLVDERLSGVASPAMAKDMRDAFEFMHDICVDPWRSAVTSWLKNDPEAAALIADTVQHPEKFSYHCFIGNICEAFGQSLTKGEHPVISSYYNAEAPNKVQYKTRLSDGTWIDITQEQLLALERDPNGPQVVHSANHAFLDNERSDLTKLQDEFSKLFDGSRLPIEQAGEQKVAGHLSTWNPEALGPNDTITVFATHTRQNRFLNLAQLFHRLEEIDRAQAHPEADQFEHVAPIAVDMVETLLKSIVVDADVGKIRSPQPGNGKPAFFDGPVTLRPDAVDIIRRQRPRGFSKGGNDFRDGMRLLVHTLEAKDAAGEKFVVSPEGFTTCDLVSNISMIVFGLNEKPMAKYYRDHGVYVPIVSSKHDLTAPIPPFPHEDEEPVYNYKGSDVGDGHSPGYAVDGMLADWRIHDLLRMQGAVSQGQAAITDVNLLRVSDAKGYNPNVLSLEVAPGTTDAMMEGIVGPLNLALRRSGLEDTTLKRVDSNQGRKRYCLINNDPMTNLVTPENIVKLQGVFRSLSAPHAEKARDLTVHLDQAYGEHPVAGLWVSQATAFGKMSLLKHYLMAERDGKLDGPDAVIEKATLIPYVQRTNGCDVREHPRTLRNLEQHNPRIAESATAEQLIR